MMQVPLKPKPKRTTMNPVSNTLGVLSGDKELRISIEQDDIIKLSVGVFIAMLLALLITKYL